MIVFIVIDLETYNYIKTASVGKVHCLNPIKYKDNEYLLLKEVLDEPVYSYARDLILNKTEISLTPEEVDSLNKIE